ncbi:MAG: hypothetical protein ACI85F_002143 [Bacteroidia bacterium]|jgi:hypothetical protein
MESQTTIKLWQILGIDCNRKVAIVNCPEDYYELIGSDCPEFKNWSLKVGDLSMAHLFVTNLNDVRNLVPHASEKVHNDGSVWISWPNKPAKATDLNEHTIKHVAEKHGFDANAPLLLNDNWWGIELTR